MVSVPHPLFRTADNIPDDVRPDVITAVERNRMQLSWNPQDLAFLFEVYNRYIAPAEEPENINCGGCRTKVIGKMRQYVNQWTSN